MTEVGLCHWGCPKKEVWWGSLSQRHKRLCTQEVIVHERPIIDSGNAYTKLTDIRRNKKYDVDHEDTPFHL